MLNLFQELNVRQLTITSNKENYGVYLAAEPDHRTLGIKYKKQYKDLMTAIKGLTDDQLAHYQDTGRVEVLGNTLTEGELHLIYKFDSNNSGSNSCCYEAHSDDQVRKVFLFSLVCKLDLAIKSNYFLWDGYMLPIISIKLCHTKYFPSWHISELLFSVYLLSNNIISSLR